MKWFRLDKSPPPKNEDIIISGPMPWLPAVVRWSNKRERQEMEWGTKYTIPEGWFNIEGGRSRYDDGCGNLRNVEFWAYFPKPPEKGYSCEE